MIETILNFIKQLISQKELEELARYKVMISQYRQWLSEFPEITATLDNLHGDITGKDFHGNIFNNLLSITELRQSIRKEPLKDINKRSVYSSFFSIDSKLKIILLLLDNDHLFDNDDKNNLFVDLSSYIPFGAQLNLQYNFNVGQVVSNKFTFERYKTLLLQFKLIKEIKQANDPSIFICTKRGKDFIACTKLRCDFLPETN